MTCESLGLGVRQTIGLRSQLSPLSIVKVIPSRLLITPFKEPGSPTLATSIPDQIKSSVTVNGLGTYYVVEVERSEACRLVHVVVLK